MHPILLMSKEWVRKGIAEGGIVNTGERAQESTAYSENAVDRVSLTVENIDKWGTKWIVFPNAVYGSSANYASQYGFSELFDYFDYTRADSKAWELYD